MKTHSSFLSKCSKYICGSLLALVWFSVGTICVFADNPPTLTIVQPADGASFIGPADVTIEATASDSDGFVTQVDFYWFPCGSTTLLASFTAPPYSFTLTNLISGNFSVSVSVLDSGGNQTVSNFVFNVVGPIQSLVNAAAPGSTVDIPAGVYLDTVVINKSLTLRGAGARSTAIDGYNRCKSNLGAGIAITGAALTITGGATVTMSGLTVTRGGIYNDSTLTVNDCAITGNAIRSGIENTTSGTLLLNNSTVSGNAIQDDGGGVYNLGTMILSGCTISGNLCGLGKEGGDGGGLLNFGTLSLNNCTVTGNTALTGFPCCGGNGGGIANFVPGTIVNCKSTIIANNLGSGSVGGTPSPDFAGELNSQGYNLIGSTVGTVILGITTGNLLDIDPLLGPLQNNGGPTDTHALLPGSPAIDAGISGGLNTHQRGFPRPVDTPSVPNAADGSDIGAYEFNSSEGALPLNINCPSDIAANNDAGQCSAVVNFLAPSTSGGAGNVDVVCIPASGSVFPIGTTMVTCTATDASGATAACSFNVTVQDAESPAITSLAATPSVLRPINNRMTPVHLDVAATDNCGSTTCQIISVTSTDPTIPLPNGRLEAYWLITGDLSLYLRAGRNTPSVARTYTITIECTDVAGNASTKTVDVVVPK